MKIFITSRNRLSIIRKKSFISTVIIFSLISALILLFDLQLAYAWTNSINNHSFSTPSSQSLIEREHLPGSLAGNLVVYDDREPQPCEVTWLDSNSSDLAVKITSKNKPLSIHTIIIRDFFGKSYSLPTPDFSQTFQMNFMKNSTSQYRQKVLIEHETRETKNINILRHELSAIYDILFNPTRGEFKVKVQVLISNGISSQSITNNTTIFTCSK